MHIPKTPLFVSVIITTFEQKKHFLLVTSNLFKDVKMKRHENKCSSWVYLFTGMDYWTNTGLDQWNTK